MKIITLNRLSSKYVFASLTLIIIMLLIYGMSDGNNAHPKFNSVKSKPLKSAKSSMNSAASEETEYMTQSQAHLLKQRQKEKQLLAGINMKKDSPAAQTWRDSEHTLRKPFVRLPLFY